MILFVCGLCNYAQAQDDLLFPVKKFGQWGYINQTGKLVIDCQFSAAGEFHEGLAKVASRNSENNLTLWGVIDSMGKYLFNLEFTAVSDFSYGKAWAQQIDSENIARYYLLTSKGERFLFAQGGGESQNESGRSLISKKYFQDGVTSLVMDGFRDVIPDFISDLTLINTSGKLITITTSKTYKYSDYYPAFGQTKSIVVPEYSSSLRTWEGYYANDNYIQISLSEVGWLYLNKSFDSVATIRGVEDIGNFDYGLAPASIIGPNREKLYGYININGQFIIEPRYQGASPFSDSRAIVALNNHYGVIDTLGKSIVEPQYEEITSFNNGLARFQIITNDKFPQEKWGVLDKSGKIKIQAKYDKISEFREGFAIVELFGRAGFIDKNGKYIVKILETKPNNQLKSYPGYKDADLFSEGLARVQDDKGKWGFIDLKGQTRISHRFEKVENFKNGLARYYEGKKAGFVDKNGMIIWKASE